MLLSIFTIVEGSVFAIAMSLILSNKVLKKITLVSMSLFVIYSIISLLLSPAGNNIDSFSIIIEFILIIIYSLFYFFEEMNHPDVTFIYSSYQFWLVVGILIYSTGTFFLFTFSQYFVEAEWEKWGVINYVFTLLKNALFSIAVVMPKEPKPFQSFEI